MFIDDTRLNRAMELTRGENGMWYRLIYGMLRDRGLRYEWFV